MYDEGTCASAQAPHPPWGVHSPSGARLRSVPGCHLPQYTMCSGVVTFSLRMNGIRSGCPFFKHVALSCLPLSPLRH